MSCWHQVCGNELILEFPTKSMPSGFPCRGDSGSLATVRDRTDASPYSILICACELTLPQGLVSSAKNLAASAGEPIIGSRVSLVRLATTSGCLRPSTTSRLILSANAAGVAGGATMANQVTERKPDNPDSASVGTSATTGERSAPPTARIFALPARYIRAAVVRVSKNMSIWPAMTSLRAGTAPRYGTCTILMLPSPSSWLAERCAVEPAPCDP